MANRVTLSPEYFPNPTIGRPVSNGYVYVGEIDLDPKIVGNQKQVSLLQEDGSEVEVCQPVSLNAGGTPTYNGSPVTILVEGSYSLRVDDKHGAQVYYVPKNAEATGDKTVETIADLRLISGDYASQGVNVQGYYAVGDGGGGPRRYWNVDTYAPSDDNGGSVIVPTGVTTGAWLFECDIFDVVFFGADPTGVAESGTHIHNTIIAAAGKPVKISEEYKAEVLSTTTITGNIDLFGSGTINGNDAATSGFIVAADLDYLRIKDITFTNFGIRVFDVDVTTRVISEIKIIKTTVKDSVNAYDFDCNCRNVLVTGNIIDNLSGAFTVNGFRFGTNTVALQELSYNYLIENNIITNLESSGAGAEVHGVILYGRYGKIKNNIIQNISNASGTGAEGIYTKCRYSEISGNALLNGGTGEASINCKGGERVGATTVQGYDLNVHNNIIESTSTHHEVAIEVQTDDVTVHHNTIEGKFDLYGIHMNQGTNLNVSDNIFKNITSQLGINCRTEAESVVINNNYFTGIIGDGTNLSRVIHLHGGPYGTVECVGNTIIDDDNYIGPLSLYGITIQFQDGNVEHVNVSDNIIRLYSSTLDIRGINSLVTAVTIDKLTMLGNDITADGVATSYPFFMNATTAAQITSFEFGDDSMWGMITAPSTISVEVQEVNSIIENTGAVAATEVRLPVAVKNLSYTLARIATQALRAAPDGTDVIRGGGAGKYLELQADGDNVRLKCITAGTWDIMAGVGTYAYEA